MIHAQLQERSCSFFVSSVLWWWWWWRRRQQTTRDEKNVHRLSQRLRTFIFCWHQYNGNLWYFVWLSSFKQQLFVLRTLFWIFQEWIKYIDYEILITLCIFYLNWNCLEKSWVWSSLSIFVFVTNPSQQKMKRRSNQSRKMQQHASSRSELCCSAAAAAAAIRWPTFTGFDWFGLDWIDRRIGLVCHFLFFLF